MVDGPQRGRRRELFEDERAFASVLVAALFEDYGPDIIEWDPQTLWLEVSEDYGVRVPPVLRSRTWALLTALSSNAPFLHWEPFEKLCKDLNREFADFHIVDPPSPEEIAWCITELRLHEVHPEFSAEVKGYCRRVFYDHGFFRVAPFLNFCDLNDRARAPVDVSDVAPELMDLEQQLREKRITLYIQLNADQLRGQSERYLARAINVPVVEEQAA